MWRLISVSPMDTISFLIADKVLNDFPETEEKEDETDDATDPVTKVTKHIKW